MNQQMLIDLVLAALVTLAYSLLLTYSRMRVADESFRVISALSATIFVVLASVIWKTPLFSWLLGTSPTFLPAVLVILVAVSIQAATRSLDRIEEPRLGKLGRRIISLLPVDPGWTDRLLTWAYAVSLDHFPLSAKRVIMDIEHRETSHIPYHHEYSCAVELCFGRQRKGHLKFAVEIAPQTKPAGDMLNNRSTFGVRPPGAASCSQCPTLLFHPLLDAAGVIENQLNHAKVTVEISDINGQFQNVGSAKDENITSGVSNASRRILLFDCVLVGPSPKIRIHIDDLLHTEHLPIFYFQPQVLALDEWELNVKARNSLSLQYPTIVPGQLPIGGEVNYERQKMKISHHGGRQNIEGEIVHVPVMPWTTVHYALVIN